MSTQLRVSKSQLLKYFAIVQIVLLLSTHGVPLARAGILDAPSRSFGPTAYIPVGTSSDPTPASSHEPNDPLVDHAWWLDQVEAVEAWGLSTGAGVTIAYVDTGLDLTHADIGQNVWINVNEIANNGIDDDQNGFIDDVYGWDFANSDNDVTDDHGHGTHVAGISSAVANNKIGIAGIAHDSKVMALKALDTFGSGFFTDITAAIYYAINQGAKVINMSLEAAFEVSLTVLKAMFPVEYDEIIQPFHDAVKDAWEAGVMVVVAAGNGGNNTNQVIPAGFEESVTVSSTTETDSLASSSNTGLEVDLSAPGRDILSLRAKDTLIGRTVGNDYVFASGTSMAAPMVSGIAALLFAQDPLATPADVLRRMAFSAVDLGAVGFDTSFGFGRVNAFDALSYDYYADGSIKTHYLVATGPESLIRIDYDSEGQVQRKTYANGTYSVLKENGDEVFYDANDRITKWVTPEGIEFRYKRYFWRSAQVHLIEIYKDDKKIGAEYYDRKGNLTSRLTYNSQGKLSSYERYRRGKLRSILTFYASGKRASYTIFHARGGKRATFSFFENGRLRSFDLFDLAGRLVWSWSR